MVVFPRCKHHQPRQPISLEPPSKREWPMTMMICNGELLFLCHCKERKENPQPQGLTSLHLKQHQEAQRLLQEQRLHCCVPCGWSHDQPLQPYRRSCQFPHRHGFKPQQFLLLKLTEETTWSRTDTVGFPFFLFSKSTKWVKCILIIVVMDISNEKPVWEILRKVFH